MTAAQMESKAPIREPSWRALILLLNLLAAACVSEDQPRAEAPTPIDASPDRPEPAADGARAIEPPAIPAPPALATVPNADGEVAVVKFLVDATSRAAPESLAAWLRVYALADVPVVVGRQGQTANSKFDPIGPDYWMVWAANAFRPGSGIALLDALKPVGSLTDAVAVTTALLADLRTAVQSADARARFFARFTLEKVRRASHGNDPLDPLVDVTALRVDPKTALLVQWAALRAVAFSAPTKRQKAAPARLDQNLYATKVPTPCAEAWGSENSTFIVNFLVNQGALGGLQLPGMSAAFPSLVDALGKLNPGLIDADAVTRVKGIAGKANVIAGVLSLVLQYSALTLDVSMAPVPLVRTKKAAAHGNKGELHFKLSMDSDILPDGNKSTACAASFMLNAMGVGFSLPPKGPVANAGINVTGRQGFADRLDESAAFVLFGDYRQIKQDLNDQGQAVVAIWGRQQKQDFPDDAAPWDREFSLDVEAQPEPLTGRSLFSTFFNSLSFGATLNPLAIVAPIIDIVKSVHWDYGEYFYPLVDWLPPCSTYIGSINPNPAEPGTKLLIKGGGFGGPTAPTLTFVGASGASKTVTASSWTDTEIRLETPYLPAGAYTVTAKMEQGLTCGAFVPFEILKSNACVEAGTRVALGNGLGKAIEDVRPGDRILALDPQTGRVRDAVVKQLLVHGSQSYALTTLQLSRGQKLRATANHPVLTGNNTWVAVEDLEPGDVVYTLVSSTGAAVKVTIVSIVRDESKADVVYNLLTSAGNYFANDLLIHNKCLAAGSLIDTPAGPVAIDAIRVGQLVYGERAGHRVPTRVTHRYEKATVLTQIPGKRLTPHVAVTNNHPVRVGPQFVPAGSLASPDREIRGTVFDLKTETGNYFADGLLLGGAE